MDGGPVGGEAQERLVAVDQGVPLRRCGRRQALGAQPAVLVRRVGQAGDAVGEQQRGVRGEGLVLGGQEPFVGPPEAGAHGAVAEQRGEAEQPRAVVEGEALPGAARAGEARSVGGGQTRGAPGAADVVEEQDLHGVGEGTGALGDGGRGADGQPVLGVHEVQPPAPRPCRPRRTGRGVTGSVRQGQHGEGGGVPLGDLPRPVPDGGDDHLDAGEGVGVQGVEEGGQVVLDVAAVDDDAEVGGRLGHRGDGHRGDSFAFVAPGALLWSTAMRSS